MMNTHGDTQKLLEQLFNNADIRQKCLNDKLEIFKNLQNSLHKNEFKYRFRNITILYDMVELGNAYIDAGLIDPDIFWFNIMVS